MWLDPVIALQGDTINMNCLPDHNLHHYTSYTWLRGGGKLLPGGVDSLHSRVITLENIRASDTGKYKCIANASNHTINYDMLLGL